MPTPEAMARGARFRAARKAAGFRTLLAIANHVGTSVQTILEVEKGRRKPEIYLLPLAEALGRSPHYLMHGVEQDAGPATADPDPAWTEAMRHAVEDYLASELARDLPEWVASRLREPAVWEPLRAAPATNGNTTMPSATRPQYT